MTKSELIEQVSELLKLPAGKAEQIVNCIFDSMVTALQDGEGIEIRGLGSFTVREYRAYEGRNPRTGETVHVGPKRLPFFKVGKDLRDRVNRAAGTGGLDESPDDDDDLDELIEAGNGHHGGNGAGHGAGNGAGNGTHGGAGWNDGGHAPEHHSPNDGLSFGRTDDGDSSDVS